MQSIGFIGLGNMGGNMAVRYLAAGYTVYGEDRDRAAAQSLVDQGLRWADTPRDEAWFDIGLMHKDIRLAREAGAEHKTPLPTAGVADEILTKAEQLGYTHRDIASVHDLLAHLPDNATPVTS